MTWRGHWAGLGSRTCREHSGPSYSRPPVAGDGTSRGWGREQLSHKVLFEQKPRPAAQGWAWSQTGLPACSAVLQPGPLRARLCPLLPEPGEAFGVQVRLRVRRGSYHLDKWHHFHRVAQGKNLPFSIISNHNKQLCLAMF